MSVKGKRLAMIKHTCEVARSVINNTRCNHNTPFLHDVALFHIIAQSGFRMGIIQSTPADRFNDDGTLKPTPELQPGERYVKVDGLEDDYIPREPKNFEASV